MMRCFGVAQAIVLVLYSEAVNFNNTTLLVETSAKVNERKSLHYISFKYIKCADLMSALGWALVAL